jgi:uncharacterized protein involved in exopolysaccharide biosynthesis
MDQPAFTTASLRDFLNVLFKRKAHVLLFFAATVATVTVGTFLMKPTYEATSQILVKIGRENLYIPTVAGGGNQSPVINLNREEQINSEIEILKSQSLLEQVVKSLGPTKIYETLGQKEPGILGKILGSGPSEESPLQRAVAKLEKDLTVEGIKKSNVIEVSVKNTDPVMAAAVTNKLVKLYLDRHLEVFKTPQSYKFFQDQSEILMNKHKETAGRLEAFKKQHNITSLDEERSLMLKQEGALREALNQTLSQLSETENRILQLQQQLAATPRTIPQGEETGSSPYVLNTLQGRLMELELKEKELLTKYTEQSRLVQSTREEIKIVRDKLAEQEAKQYGMTRSGANPTHQRLQEDLFKSQADLKALQAKRNTQTGQLAEYRNRLEKLNAIEVELNQLQRQVEVDQQNYRLYLTKFEEARISDAMDTEKMTNVTQIQAAEPPLKPVRPRVLLNLVLGVFLGAFGGLGLAFFMEYLDDTLEKPEDAESALNLPVLASIPELKTR